MERQGLWNLFWATGLPEAWVCMRGEPGEEKEGGEIENPPDPSVCPKPREI